MTIRIVSAIIAITLAFASCKNDSPKQETTPPADAAPTGNAIATEDATQIALPESNMPTLSAPGSAVATQQPAPATGGSGAAPKTNPPHGQPGHVCGVPVGSPLDGSAAAKPAATQPASTPPPAPTPQPAANVTVEPGTNPPHGQPGHVCGTPVGAPLPKQ
ncbi:MAG: hypothetical protein KF734_03445 [Saprospiraceae bacterium]|nr:hypothetical protein [Saprospiraceae bacterium]